MNLPEYQGNSIVNLISSLLNALGVNNSYNNLSDFDLNLDKYKNIVFIVIDGLGYEFLIKQNEGLLKNSLKRKITSVFPTTTASAISSFLTGQAPLQHAMTGWFMYFKETGCASLPLPFTNRYSTKGYDDFGIRPHEIFNFKNIFDQLSISYEIISPKKTINSPYSIHSFGTKNKIGYENHNDFFDIISKTIKKNSDFTSANKNMIYAYYPFFDEFSHIYGSNSNNCVDLFHKIETSLNKLKNNFIDKETLFIVTADHGLIDIPQENKLKLNDFPKLQSCLSLPLCGENRVPFCYVRPSKLELFKSFVTNEMDKYCSMLSIDEALDMNLFGLGEMNPKFFDRVGDYILLMKENYILYDLVLNENVHPFIGYHGGLSDQELYVPLIIL